MLDATQGKFAVDIRAGLWHCFFALQNNSILFEVKPGPYNPNTDKDAAPWAPAEDSSEASKYLKEIENRFRTVCNLPKIE